MRINDVGSHTIHTLEGYPWLDGSAATVSMKDHLFTMPDTPRCWDRKVTLEASSPLAFNPVSIFPSLSISVEMVLSETELSDDGLFFPNAIKRINSRERWIYYLKQPCFVDHLISKNEKHPNKEELLLFMTRLCQMAVIYDDPSLLDALFHAKRTVLPTEYPYFWADMSIQILASEISSTQALEKLYFILTGKSEPKECLIKKTIELFCERGLSPQIQDSEGSSLVDIARNNAHTDTAEFLEKRMSDQVV